MVTPVAVTYLNLSDDVATYFFEIEEEEEKSAKENIEIELLITKSTHSVAIFSVFDLDNRLPYFSKQYTTPYFSIVSPPPELRVS